MRPRGHAAQPAHSQAATIGLPMPGLVATVAALLLATLPLCAQPPSDPTTTAPTASQPPQSVITSAPAIPADSPIPTPTALLTDAFDRIENDSLELVLSRTGGGIVSARLKAFADDIHSPDRQPYPVLQPWGTALSPATLRAGLGMTSFSLIDITLSGPLAEFNPALSAMNRHPLGEQLTLNGQTRDVQPVIRQERLPDQSIRQIYEERLDLNGAPAMWMQRSFTLNSPAAMLEALQVPEAEHARWAGAARVIVSQQFTNLTDQPVQVSFRYTGPLGLRSEDPRGDPLLVFSGYQRASDGKYLRDRHDRSNAILFGQPPTDLSNLGSSILPNADRLTYTANANRYFLAIARPLALGTTSRADLLRYEPHTAAYAPDLTTMWQTALLEIPPGQTLVYDVELLLVPQVVSMLRTSPVAKELGMHLLPDEHTPPCTCADLTWLMGSLIFAFHTVTTDYGWAIILLVIVVKLILHPLARFSSMQLMKFGEQMKKLKPKLDAIKARHGDDKAALNNAMQQMMREQQINPIAPALGCLPLFIQMPIWVALYSSINYTFELRHESFWPLGFWIRDLASPDAIIRWQGFDIPLISWLFHTGPLASLNILPFGLAFFMYLNQKLMPQPSAQMDPQQEAIQKTMLRVMPFFFLVIMYNMPSGLNLYIMTSMAIGVWEQKRIRKIYYRLHPESDPARQPPATEQPVNVAPVTRAEEPSWRERESRKRRKS